jgi:hypothetical protein
MALFWAARKTTKKLGRPGIRFEASKTIAKGAKISRKFRENFEIQINVAAQPSKYSV